MKMSESLLWLFCHEQPERITHGHSFKERLIEERPQEPFAPGLNTAENQRKTVKKTYKKYVFLANRSFFESHSLESLTLLFFKEIKSDLLMVALFKE